MNNPTKMNCCLFSRVLILIAALAGSAGAVTGEAVLSRLKWGDDPGTVASRLREQGISPTLLEATDKQALSKIMLRSRLLETLNSLGFKDTFLPRAAGPRARRFIAFNHGGRFFVLLFQEEGGLFQAYVRIAVRVDRTVGGRSNRFTRQRLDPLRKELQMLRNGFDITPKRSDRHGNAFEYSGRKGGTYVALLYDPVEEEIRAVYAAAK